MSLEITENNWTLVRQYWNTDTAYNDIIHINGNNADVLVIMAQEQLARRILSDWVWASNYRTIRYISGYIPSVKQYAYKRIYPDTAMARRALAAEVNSNENWLAETNAAQQIMQNQGLQNQVFAISTNIWHYLTNTARLRNILGQRTSDYVSYYRFRYTLQTLQGGVWGVLNEVVNQQDTDLTTNIAVIHDLAILLQDVAPNANDQFVSFPRHTLRMTVLNPNNGNAQEVQANQIDNNGNILDNPIQEGMRWTFSGGRFPDNRTINENHPAIRYARSLQRPVQMGPSRTTASMLHLANQALMAQNVNNIETLLAHLTLGLFAFWNQSYNRRCTLIHCYHFVTDCAVCNFGVQRATMNQIFNVPLAPPYP